MILMLRSSSIKIFLAAKSPGDQRIEKDLGSSGSSKYGKTQLLRKFLSNKCKLSLFRMVSLNSLNSSRNAS